MSQHNLAPAAEATSTLAATSRTSLHLTPIAFVSETFGGTSGSGSSPHLTAQSNSLQLATTNSSYCSSSSSQVVGTGSSCSCSQIGAGGSCHRGSQKESEPITSQILEKTSQDLIDISSSGNLFVSVFSWNRELLEVYREFVIVLELIFLSVGMIFHKFIMICHVELIKQEQNVI